MQFDRLLLAITVLAPFLSTSVAGADYLYVAEGFNRPIYQVTPDGTAEELITIPQVGAAGPWLASDGIGHLYVSGRPINKLGAGAVSVVPADVGFPEQIAADRQGNVYIVDQGSVIDRFAPNGTTSGVASGVFNGIVTDVNGNLFVVGSFVMGGGGIERFAPDGTVSRYGPSFFPVGGQPAVDAAGNLYVLGLTPGDAQSEVRAPCT